MSSAGYSQEFASYVDWGLIKHQIAPSERHFSVDTPSPSPVLRSNIWRTETPSVTNSYLPSSATSRSKMAEINVKSSKPKLVQVGRVLVFVNGPHKDKIAVIVEIIDFKRVRSSPKPILHAIQ